MSNPKRKPTSVTREIVLGGKTLVMVFDFTAVAILEDLYDLPLARLGEVFADPTAMRVRDVQRIVYAGLKSKNPDLTLDETLAILNEAVTEGQSVSDILAETMEAFDASAGEEDGDARPPQAAT